MKLIKLTHRIFYRKNGDASSEIVSVYINIDCITAIVETSKETKELYKHQTRIIFNTDTNKQEVCEDIEQVIQAIKGGE